MDERKTIGLCLSGGGHRATAFALGALLYLVQAGVHRRIKTISSVSGGSLVSGYLATRDKALCEQSAEEVTDSIETLAAMVAGDPRRFWCALCALIALLALWCIDISAFRPWSDVPLPVSQLVFVAALLVHSMAAAKNCGTFWGWWGTWAYVGVVIAALVISVAVWASDLHFLACLAIAVVAPALLLLRCKIAQLAFEATLFRGVDDEKMQLTGMHGAAPQYVFCGTEMHSGDHSYFTRDLLFVPRLGLGVPNDLRVSTAVQVSANFPVAFPFRAIRAAGHRFALSELPQDAPLPKFLVFTDGGVHDNMAVTWFLSGAKHGAILESALRRRPAPNATDDQRLRAQIATMKGSAADVILVVNSSEPYVWRKAARSLIPLWGEIRALARINSAMYNQLGIAQKDALRKLFLRRPGTGAVISIGEPWHGLHQILNDPIECEKLALQLDLSPETVDQLRAASNPALTPYDGEALHRLNDEVEAFRDAILREVTQSESREQEEVQQYRQKSLTLGVQKLLASAGDRAAQGAAVPTTFRPLGAKTTSELMHHGFACAMGQCMTSLGWPLLTSAFESKVVSFKRKGDSA